MKTPLYLFSVLTVFSLFFSSCRTCVDGIGPVLEKNIELKGFTSLDIRVPADIVLKVGDSPVASIQANENLLGLISAEIKGKTLIIDSKRCIGSADKFHIDLIVRDLNHIVLNGSGFVKSISQLRSDKMRLEINGSGKIMLEVFSNVVKADISGSGDIIVNGSTKDLDVSINGSGGFEALGLQAFSSNVDINGSGEARLNVKNKLNINLNGSGSVLYSGMPKIKTDISGSGEVRKIRD
ncbi:MAG: DUF2807 domain-containing protein [Chlorobi bacterium]|nr:DUF2807 domain-containing protein [Chlorobiota bacterium]